MISLYKSTCFIGLFIFSTVIWSCSDTTSYNENDLDKMGQILASGSHSNQQLAGETNLFDLIPEDSRQTLTEEQERLVAVIKNRPTTAELHFANLVIDPQNLLKEGKTLGMPLPDEKLFVAVGERATVNKMGYLSWIGKSENPLNTASLVLGPEGELGGSLRAEGSYYRFEPLGGDLLAIILIDPSKFPPEHPPELASGVLIDTATVDIGDKFDTKEGDVISISSGPNPGPDIDLLVVYTPAAASASTDINTLINIAVNETNQSFGNSNIYANVILQHTGQVNYNEAGRTYVQHVTALQSTSDGIMENVHSLRNEHIADVVLLIVDDPSACGVAYELLANQTTAFAVVHYDCTTSPYFSFGHEIGHLMGAQHDPFVNHDNPHFDYGYGYVDPNNQWRTVMAYGDACNFCPRIDYWSNPNVNHPTTGQPMGTSANENNALVLNTTKYNLRDFRTLPPPSGFTLTNPWSYGNNPVFNWTQVPEADHHTVYRCITTSGYYNDACFQPVGSGSNQWTDEEVTIVDPIQSGGCTEEGVYHVTSYNRTGESGYQTVERFCIDSPYNL